MLRTRLLAAAALTAALAAAPLSAQAAPRHHENDLRSFCDDVTTTECVAVADNDEGRLVIVDRAGHHHTLRTQHAALRYLRHHALRCTEEDSPRCYWNAGTAGNGRGDSFIVIADDTLWYLGNL